MYVIALIKYSVKICTKNNPSVYDHNIRIIILWLHELLIIHSIRIEPKKLHFLKSPHF